jgi:D-alanyl-D-alanine carboxypeptidase
MAWLTAPPVRHALRRPALAAALAGVLLALNPAHSSPAHAAAVAPVRELAVYADTLLAASYPPDGPGAAVLIRRGGETVLRRGYGLASIELGVPISPDQVFEIGSVTKQFTAAAIMKLAERGALSVSDSLTRFLPGFPTGGHTVTLEHLLTHTSGIPSYTDFPEWVPRWREDMSVDTLIGLFRGKPLEFVPGERWSYSNSGYILLGAVIEEVSNRSYEDFVERELLEPAGMTHSRYGHQEELVPGRVEGYSKVNDGYVPAPYLSLTQPYAAGSLLSTVDDLARWLDALQAGKVVSAASRDRMFTPEILHGGDLDGESTRYGFGIAIGEIAGRTVLEHGGGIHGFVCDVLAVPEEKLQVIILSNNPAGRNNPQTLARRIAARALGNPIEARPVLALSPAQLDEYVGAYRVPEKSDEQRVISREGSSLRLQRAGGMILALSAFAPDRFAIEGRPTIVRFVRDATGRVIAADVDQGIGPISRSPRIERPLPVGGNPPGGKKD